MISEGDPNGCNLCHLDRSVGWTLEKLKEGWNVEVRPGQRTAREALERPAGEVYLSSKRSITRMAGIDAYARSPSWKAHLPEITQALNDAAPTLSTMLNIPVPGASAGRVLTEALQGRVAGTQTSLSGRRP